MSSVALPRARLVGVFLTVVAFLFWTAAFAQTEESRKYQLGSGDKIYITVFGHDDLSGEFDIDGTGNVSFPLVGNIQMGGLTIEKAEVAIRNALKPDYLIDPRVSVQVLNYRPFYILGEVKTPGSYPYVNGMTVMQAVALAGGYTYRARENNVLILRTGPEGQTEQPAKETTVVLPGDIVKVPERFF